MKNTIQTSTPIGSRIIEVVVYLSGAQITRTGSLLTKEGVQKLIFEKLPAGLKPESIQVSAGNGVIIRSVEHAVNHFQSADYSEEITILKKRLDDLTRERQRENNKIKLGTLEENLFSENIRLAGKESGLTADNLKAAVLFYNERMASVQGTRMACEQRIEELDREISAVKAHLGGYSNKRPDPVSEITVTVVADKEIAADITVSYFVYNASWQPSYDIRAKGSTGDIDLHYKANVSQSTGENWDEVRLTLSTGNPNVGGNCPELQPWYLDFQRQRLVDSKKTLQQFQQFNMARTTAESCDDEAVEECMAAAQIDEVAPVTITESVTSVEYNIKAPYTVASGDGGQDVEITVHSLPAKYRYYSIRKLEREVFLLAAASGWEHLNLIAGEASVFFENRYVGKTMIDPRRADESIDLPLGVDKSVMVTRVRGKEFTAKTLVGGSVKQTRQWELTARNLKTVPIDIEVLDQVPVSVNKQITVDAAEISGAEMDKDTGILTWKFTLKPAESKSMAVKYVVTSPKNTTVLLD
jgi:uncharacterized protein (TIGR02231 family)